MENIQILLLTFQEKKYFIKNDKKLQDYLEKLIPKFLIKMLMTQTEIKKTEFIRMMIKEKEKKYMIKMEINWIVNIPKLK